MISTLLSHSIPPSILSLFVCVFVDLSTGLPLCDKFFVSNYKLYVIKYDCIGIIFLFIDVVEGIDLLLLFLKLLRLYVADSINSISSEGYFFFNFLQILIFPFFY